MNTKLIIFCSKTAPMGHNQYLGIYIDLLYSIHTFYQKAAIWKC